MKKLNITKQPMALFLMAAVVFIAFLVLAFSFSSGSIFNNKASAPSSETYNSPSGTEVQYDPEYFTEDEIKDYVEEGEKRGWEE